MTSREETQLKRQAANSLRQAGFPNKDIARALGVSSGYVTRLLADSDSPRVPFVKDPERDPQMVYLYREGKTLEEIGQQFDVTRERVRQILARNGVKGENGGAHHKHIVAAIKRQKEHRARWDRFTLTFYGCSNEQLNEINGGLTRSRAGSPAYIFMEQKKNAHARGVLWEISLPDWWRIWQESGKWDLRGRGRGRYCMARLGDSGPYSAGNVEIISNEQNGRDSFLITPSHKRFGREPADPAKLTPRQQEAAALMAQGVSHKEAAQLWGVCPHVAWSHYDAAKKKRALQPAEPELEAA